jgi:hypothetical protein
MTPLGKLRRFVLAAGMLAAGYCAARGEWLAGLVIGALAAVWWRVLQERRPHG